MDVAHGEHATIGEPRERPELARARRRRERRIERAVRRESQDLHRRHRPFDMGQADEHAALEDDHRAREFVARAGCEIRDAVRAERRIERARRARDVHDERRLRGRARGLGVHEERGLSLRERRGHVDDQRAVGRAVGNCERSAAKPASVSIVTATSPAPPGPRASATATGFASFG